MGAVRLISGSLNEQLKANITSHCHQTGRTLKVDWPQLDYVRLLLRYKIYYTWPCGLSSLLHLNKQGENPIFKHILDIHTSYIWAVIKVHNPQNSSPFYTATRPTPTREETTGLRIGAQFNLISTRGRPVKCYSSWYIPMTFYLPKKFHVTLLNNIQRERQNISLFYRVRVVGFMNQIRYNKWVHSVRLEKRWVAFK